METTEQKMIFRLGKNLDLGEYQRRVLFSVLLVEGVISVSWQLFANNQLILLLAFLLHGFAIFLITRSLPLAGLAWAGAFYGVIYSSAIVYQLPIILFLICLFPLGCVLIFGYLSGTCALGMNLFILIFIQNHISAFSRYPEFVPGIIGGSLAGFFLGAIVRFWFLDTLNIFHAGYLYASGENEKAREERVEYKQIQDDLMHANRELARLTQQLRIANQTAEEARRAKETFVATVSHELRTPLNMIIGFSEVIAQSPHVYGTKLPPTLLADISSIQRNSQHLLELVNDVLDLSQVDMGNFSISRSKCSIEMIINEAVEVIHPLFQSKGLDLKVNTQPDIGELDCDHTRIREVIINLLSNAGRFTEKGGVVINASKTDGEVLIAVQDTGPGISPADQERLFEPFQQLDDTIRRKHGGSGLGLAISKRFVEMHGGKMWLVSSVGEGTTFYFSLPLPDDLIQDSTLAERWVNEYSVVEPRQRPFKAPVNSLVPLCIVLEEGDIAKRLFERYLGNVEIVSVSGVPSLFTSLEESPPQLIAINRSDADEVITDIYNHGKLPFGLPILSFWLPGSADMAFSYHAQSYLIKPVSRKALIDAINQIGVQVNKILLVDDNPEILQLFGRILAAADRRWTVLRASDGEQALSMLRKRRPDIMILDLIMPGLSGYSVLEEKAKDQTIRDIPTIIITAQDPAGVQKIDGQITLSRQDGFSPKDLLEFIKATGFLGN